MPAFTDLEQTPATYLRAITLFGRNTATYKFALGRALLELAKRGQTRVSLHELAVPFSAHLIAHLSLEPKQVVNTSSRFLEGLRSHITNDLPRDEMLELTVRLGFQNVLDAFHMIGGASIPLRFFEDDRRSKSAGIVLTDALLALYADQGARFANLDAELESRWRLVETAWSLEVNPAALEISADLSVGSLVYSDAKRRRKALTSVRGALNGYQKGHCFYCNAPIDMATCEVDHFFPWMLGPHLPVLNLDGIWNLVLSCTSCNRGEDGKFAHAPAKEFVARLHTRNEYLIQSHHPLRETLIAQTGMRGDTRAAFIGHVDREAVALRIHRWRPREIQAAVI